MMIGPSGAEERPAIHQLRDFLRRELPGSPETIETHTSLVFLTEERAYKLKKPVRHTFHDLRSPDARRIDCEQEVEINQILAPGIYLGVETITLEPSGDLVLGGEGEVVDWLVVMRRIPADQMLNVHLQRGTRVDLVDVERLASHLAHFYATTARVPIGPVAYLLSLSDVLDADEERLVAAEALLAPVPISEMVATARRGVQRHRQLDARAHLVVDGHGDLRPEHVVLGDPPLVIDRLTCDRRLRLVDPMYDLALLAIECDVAGGRQVGESIVSRFVRLADDPIEPATMNLYGGLRALTRARLSIAHLDNGDVDEEEWLGKTGRYLSIAATQLEDFSRRGFTRRD